METSKLITSLNKTGIGSHTELVQGDASIYLSLAEFDQKRLIDMPYTFKDMISYLWNPYLSGGPVFSADNSTALNDSSTLYVGAPLSHPFKDLKDLKWKLSVAENSAVIGEEYVSNPLFIYNHDIKFYNIFDSSSSFKLDGTETDIFLEDASIHDISNNDWNDYQYSIYKDSSTTSGIYFLESSLGEISEFYGPILMSADASGRMEYALQELFNVPLLSFNNFKCTDVDGSIHVFSSEYILDIKNGKIGFNDTSSNTTEYINFNYDTSLNEQLIQHSTVYESDRFPICVIDPSIYYSQIVPDASVIVLDNSIYSMLVHHTGDYNVEVYGWDSYNNSYYNQSTLKHRIFLKSPKIYTITGYDQHLLIDTSIVSVIDVSNYMLLNPTPIYDRIYPMYGLTRKEDLTGDHYIELPSITYFQDLPLPDSIIRIFNLTERVISQNGNDQAIDINFQSFELGDSISLVKYDKRNYAYLDSADASVTNIVSNTVTVNSIPVDFVVDSSTDIFIINSTLRDISNIVSQPTDSSSSITVTGYEFQPTQLINLIVEDTDPSSNYSWGAAYRVIDVSSNVHILDGNIPYNFINDPRYIIRAKHAFTTFSTTDIKTTAASEVESTFKIYLDDMYNEEWFLDNTFAVINMLFDQTKVNLDWADSSSYSTSYNQYYNPIISDTSTMVLLTASFDSSTYMLNQKNIWTVRYNESKMVLFRVHNNQVPYVFSEKGYYDVQLESYDSYGNIATINCEGLIKIT